MGRKNSKIAKDILDRFTINNRGNTEYVNEMGEVIELSQEDIERLEIFGRWVHSGEYVLWLKKQKGV